MFTPKEKPFPGSEKPIECICSNEKRTRPFRRSRQFPELDKSGGCPRATKSGNKSRETSCSVRYIFSSFVHHGHRCRCPSKKSAACASAPDRSFSWGHGTTFYLECKMEGTLFFVSLIKERLCPHRISNFLRKPMSPYRNLFHGRRTQSEFVKWIVVNHAPTCPTGVRMCWWGSLGLAQTSKTGPVLKVQAIFFAQLNPPPKKKQTPGTSRWFLLTETFFLFLQCTKFFGLIF